MDIPYARLYPRFALIASIKQTWTYMGQIVPENRCIKIEAVITGIDEEPVPTIYADGFFKIDRLYIYIGLKGWA